jgi:hypothetical protein
MVFQLCQDGQAMRKLCLTDTYFLHRDAVKGCMYEKQTYLKMQGSILYIGANCLRQIEFTNNFTASTLKSSMPVSQQRGI